MYFKILKTSETGKKFQAIKDIIIKGDDEQTKLFIEIGSNGTFTNSRSVLYGEIEGVCFDHEPDLKHWKMDKRYTDDGKGQSRLVYRPRLNTTYGKSIEARFKAIPSVTRDDMNGVIGMELFNGCIGYTISNNDLYFGMIIKAEWLNDGLIIPNDCQEITYTEYTKIFK